MGGLIHPIGPEGKQTYWLRRAVVLAVLVALIVMVSVVIGNIRNAQASGEAAAEPATQPVQQNPAGEEANKPADEPTPTPEPAQDPTPAPTPAPATPAPQAPAQPNPVRTVETKQTATPSTQPEQQPVQPQPAQPAQPAQPQAQQAPAQPAEPAACDPKKMRVTINGPKQVSPGVPVTFKLSIINGSGVDCVASVNKDTFELKIYSGTDRVWTSLDCLVGLHDRREVLQPEKTLEWDLEWGANRSISQCKVHPNALRPGTYVATAQLKDAAPAQNILQLR